MATSAPGRLDPSPQRRATIADWLAEPEERGAELIGGRLIYKAMPSLDHGRTQRKLGTVLDPFDGEPGEAGRPGGWWLASEVDIALGNEGVRPDLSGWRRDRVPALPRPVPGGAITERPDWIAEVLSTSTAARDLGDKLAIYHAARIGHYWIADPVNQMLIIYRWLPEGYVFVLGASRDKVVRAEPFEAIEINVARLFGDPQET